MSQGRVLQSGDRSPSCELRNFILLGDRLPAQMQSLGPSETFSSTATYSNRPEKGSEKRVVDLCAVAFHQLALSNSRTLSRRCNTSLCASQRISSVFDILPRQSHHYLLLHLLDRHPRTEIHIHFHHHPLLNPVLSRLSKLKGHEGKAVAISRSMTCGWASLIWKLQTAACSLIERGLLLFPWTPTSVPCNPRSPSQPLSFQAMPQPMLIHWIIDFSSPRLLGCTREGPTLTHDPHILRCEDDTIPKRSNHVDSHLAAQTKWNPAVA